ncbi:MAG: hypothetical protein AAFR52_00275, partial [Pseudomonadota bacterium]
GTLRGQANYRIRLHEGEVVYAEPIQVGVRVRDLTVDSRGRIFVLMDQKIGVRMLDDSMLEPPDAKIAAARELLAGCNNCHQIDPLDKADYPGPTLVNVSRRKIGSVPGFAYSEALQTREGVWTKENMRRYLWSPNSFAPGTTMPR